MQTLIKFVTWKKQLIPGFVFAALLCGATVNVVHAQDRFKLNQLVQTGTGSSPSLIAFRQGRDMIADEKWAQAERVFNEFIKSYPTDKNVDAAWYWLAFALKREGKFKETNVTLERLIKNHPKSSWINDARAMRVEIAPQLGAEGIEITQQAEKSDTDEVKILALQSLMTLDSQRGTEIATNILKPGSASSVRLRYGQERIRSYAAKARFFRPRRYRRRCRARAAEGSGYDRKRTRHYPVFGGGHWSK